MISQLLSNVWSAAAARQRAFSSSQLLLATTLWQLTLLHIWQAREMKTVTQLQDQTQVFQPLSQYNHV